MDNIVGYICSTPWGTVSRTTPSLGWTPVLPSIPDGWRDGGTAHAPAGFRIILHPGTRFPGLLVHGKSEILAMLSPAGALPLLVFCLLYTPCVAAIASIKRELGVKYAVFVVIGQCMIAWIMAFVVRMIMMI